MEFWNCVWQAFCVATVAAPFMQLAYCMYCDQKTRKLMSAIPLNSVPTALSSTAAIEARGRRVFARFAALMAEIASASPTTATTSDTATTYTVRCRSAPHIIAIRLSAAKISAAVARCCSAGAAGGSCGRCGGGRNGDRGGGWDPGRGRSVSLAISQPILPHLLG